MNQITIFFQLNVPANHQMTNGWLFCQPMKVAPWTAQSVNRWSLTLLKSGQRAQCIKVNLVFDHKLHFHTLFFLFLQLGYLAFAAGTLAKANGTCDIAKKRTFSKALQQKCVLLNHWKRFFPFPFPYSLN